jgi:PAS domain S-box-containing protein
MRIHTKNHLTLGFLSAFLLLLVMGLFSYFSIRQLLLGTDQRLQIMFKQNAAEQILKKIIDLETAHRGYVLTFDEQYLQPYEQSIGPLKEQLDLLESKFREEPEMLAIVRQLKILAQERIEYTDQVINARKQSFDEALQLIASGKGKQITDRMRQHIERIQEYTTAQVNNLQDINDRRLATMQVTLVVMAVTMLALTAVLFYTINSQLKVRLQTEAKLTEKIAEVQELYDQAPCGYLSIKSDLFLNAINQTLLNWLGYTREEVIGKFKFEDLLSAESKEEFLETFERDFEKYKRDGVINGLEFHFLRKDGSEFPVVVNSMAVFDEQGEFVQSRTTVFDNTERIKSETKFKSVLESSPDAMLIVGQDGKIQLANHQAEKLFGYKRIDLVGRPVEILIPADFRGEHHNHRNTFFASPRRRPMGAGLNLMAERADGSSLAVEISLSPLKLEEELLVIAAIRDVTESRMAKDKIMNLNKELESFTYSVSHDLRAPLRSINGYAQILKEDFAPALNEEGVRTLDTIIRNANKMGALIDDLLDFSRLGRKEVLQDKVNVQELVAQVIEELTAKNSNIEIKVAKLGTTVGDRSMLQQVWVNLIDNAIKYSSKQPSPQIEIGCINDSRQWKTFYVRDNGVGFDMQYSGKLFGVFQRLHKMNEFEGTGVGLALVKRIIDRHNGQVWAEAAVNRGATFYFKLPQV